MINMYTPLVATNQKQYVEDCIENNMLTWHGGNVKEFEGKLAEMIGVKHCLTTFNGSVSLNAILMSILYTRGEVGSRLLVPSMTYVATVSQAILSGFRPAFVDCDDNFQINLDQLEDYARRHRNRIPTIVMVPELYADAPDMNRLVSICDNNNLILVEDSAETFACKTQGKHLGSFGLASSFSFFANKIITTGEGGCIATNDDSLAEQIKLFRNQGNIGYYRHKGVCSNLRMTNIQAAIGLAQLENLLEILMKKQLTAKIYRDRITTKAERVIPKIEYSSEWMPIFKLPEGVDFKEFNAYCNSKNFETRPGFYPVHLMEGFGDCLKMPLPNTEKMVDRYFILPCGPTLSKLEQDWIIEHTNDYLEGRVCQETSGSQATYI